MTLRATCEAALANGNVAAFLRVIRSGESSQTDDAYRVRFGGSHFDAPPWQHPGTAITVGSISSTAAGAYQFLSGTWKECVEALQLPDFSPASQDLAAVFLINRRGALDEVIAGKLDEAIRLCNREWASLPGSPYGQPTRTLAQAHAVYAQYGGSLVPAPDSTPAPVEAPTAPIKPVPEPVKKDKPMPIFLSALLQLIPGLIAVFGKDSKRAQENAATFNVVSDAVVKAVPGATDLPTAISAMVADPAVKAKAEAEIMQAPSVLALIEVGGGIVEARKRDDAAIAAPAWYRPLLTPAFLISLMLLTGVGFVLYHVITGEVWRPEDRAQVLMLAVAIVSAVTGYYLGSSLGSARKDELLKERA